MKKELLTIIISVSILNATAQEDKSFVPSGKPVFLIFSNVNSSFNENGSDSEFSLERLYLGYEYYFSKSLSGKANIDIGDPGTGSLQMTAYVKNAFLRYESAGFSARMGMIGTDQFNLIEKHWGYRYILKTLQDEHGFGSSADLGAAIGYTPAEFISFDISVLNGEGYKKVQSDSVFKYTAGVTLSPVKGLQLRFYTDLMKKASAQNTISLFAGYTFDDFRVGIEYSRQNNNRMVENHDFSGLSAFASLKIAERYSLVARYDNIWSATDREENDPWNYSRDGQLFMAGVEYSPVNGVKIAPVFTGWIPAHGSKTFTSTPGIYLELKY